jgi:hypothetical protein
MPKMEVMFLGKIIGETEDFDMPYDDIWQFTGITLSDVGMNLIGGNPTDDPYYACIQISIKNGTITVFKSQEDAENNREGTEIENPNWSVFNK